MIGRAALAALLVLAAGRAFAGGHVYAPYPALYTQECASCHIAFPPELMTAPGWKRMMTQLDRHFGADASLDGPTGDAIAAFLAGRASRRGKHAPQEPDARITKTSWFVREHRTERPVQTSLADCAACHVYAGKADYGKQGLKRGRGD